jgi:hypothetical protein
MESLISLWGWIYTICLGAFALLALVIIPLGARDLLKLFRSLGRDDK